MALIVLSFPSLWCLYLWTILAPGLTLAAAVTGGLGLPRLVGLSLNPNGKNRLKNGRRKRGVCVTSSGNSMYSSRAGQRGEWGKSWPKLCAFHELKTSEINKLGWLEQTSLKQPEICGTSSLSAASALCLNSRSGQEPRQKSSSQREKLLLVNCRWHWKRQRHRWADAAGRTDAWNSLYPRLFMESVPQSAQVGQPILHRHIYPSAQWPKPCICPCTLLKSTNLYGERNTTTS